MQIGVVFPQTEIGADREGVRAWAQAAQDLGFRHVTAYDHVLGADSARHPDLGKLYTADSMFHEPFVLYGFLAGVAPDLAPMTGIMVLPQRQTALVAKQAAEVDVLSGGRLRLGVGIGWNALEYQALGLPFRNRGRRLEEQVELLRRLWTERVLDFDGEYHSVDASGINPLPIQRPIPVWFGALSDVGLRRAARLGDGYLAASVTGESEWPRVIERLNEFLVEAGRDPAGFGLDAQVAVGDDHRETWIGTVESWRALGASHVSLLTVGQGLVGPDAHIERLRQAAQALGLDRE